MENPTSEQIRKKTEEFLKSTKGVEIFEESHVITAGPKHKIAPENKKVVASEILGESAKEDEEFKEICHRVEKKMILRIEKILDSEDNAGWVEEIKTMIKLFELLYQKW